MKLKEIAHARTGDKGEISNISVIPYDENNYEMLKEKVTEARVAEYFREICHGKVTRYELDGIHALNFVLRQDTRRRCHKIAGAGQTWKDTRHGTAGNGGLGQWQKILWRLR